MPCKPGRAEMSSARDAVIVRIFGVNAAFCTLFNGSDGIHLPYFSERGRMGRKLWSRVGDPVTVSRHGRRDKTIVYGALAEDGIKLMRQYERFDGPTFVRYLKEVRRK